MPHSGSPPYEGLSNFSKTVTSALYIAEVLPRVAEAAGHGVNAERVLVRLFLQGGAERSAMWPPEAIEGSTSRDREWDRAIDVEHGGHLIGRLEISKRRGDPVRPEEDELLKSLTAQAGLALHNVALTAQREDRLRDLEQKTTEISESQRRLVTVELRVRKEVESEITIRVDNKLALVEELLTKIGPLGADETKIYQLVEDSERLVDSSLSELRQIVRGVFPALLTEQGVIPALESQSRTRGIQVTIEAAKSLRSARMNRSAEASVYFCCFEALKRAVHPLHIKLDRKGPLVEFSVSGASFDPLVQLGQEVLQGMADRVEAVGGALQVRYQPGKWSVIHGEVPIDPHKGGTG